MTASPFSLEGKSVWVAGHRGLVGSAIVRRLAAEPISRLIVAGSDEVDLRRQQETEDFVAATRPDVAILAAARVGGIHANRSAQGQFLYDNLMIAANALEAARKFGIAKTVVLGSSCVYPREAPQPLREEYLLTGPLEPTNEGYAVAKIAALEMGKMYRRQYGMDVISLMPTNLYGPNDNFDPRTSHVLPALIRKFREARLEGRPEVVLWGTGTPRREFLHADDAADATIFGLEHYSGEEHLNVGTGTDITIRELAEIISAVAGWTGRLVFDSTMPDGTPQKLLDVSRLRSLGWSPSIGLAEGIAATYRWFDETQGAPQGSHGTE